MKEGFIPYKGHKTYYKVFGKNINGKLPLLILHGGPGSPHNYLLNLQKLAHAGRQIIFYDQIGGGKSSHVKDNSFWTIETFVDEINAVRKALKLTDLHLLGHSWGGMLAIEYLLTKPEGVRSVIFSSTIVSIPLFQAEVDKLVAKLPEPAKSIILEHEAKGTIDNEEYKKAYKAYHMRHIYRGEEWPQELQGSKNSANTDAYQKMWGLSESHTGSGSMRDWDRIADLKNIQIPALVTSGKYDEVTPLQAEVTHKNLPNSVQILFSKSAHVHTYEEEVKYLRTVTDFLDKVEQTK